MYMCVHCMLLVGRWTYVTRARRHFTCRHWRITWMWFGCWSTMMLMLLQLMTPETRQCTTAFTSTIVMLITRKPKQSYRHANPHQQLHELDLWPCDLRVNACWATAMLSMSTMLDVDSSSHFSFRAWTDIQTRDWNHISGRLCQIRLRTDESDVASLKIGLQAVHHRA